MPDDRLFHKRLGHSAKVTSLTDFEYIVWQAYVLSADDFGVMRFSPLKLQADHDRLASKPQKAIQRALEHIRDVGLITTFEHQGHTYCCQLDWQEYQKVKHPRATIQPQPTADVLEKCCGETRRLFGDWPGKKREKLPQHSENVSETFVHLARAGARETHTANGLRVPVAAEGGAGETNRVRSFVDWYGEAHERYVGVAYIGNPQKDYTAACALTDRFSDAELRDAALVWFGTDDDFARNGTRTMTKFLSRVSWCLEQVKARGIA